MFINEVQHKVGLSKKSIRYYEENGLLAPTRNKENDYRIYSEDDIEKLKVIKLLRELGVSIKELQMLQEEKITLKECMDERLRQITYEESKYLKIKDICKKIAETDKPFDFATFHTSFEEINILNKEGFTMRKIKTSKKKKIVGAILSSVIFGSFIIFIPVMISYFQFTLEENIPWIIYGFLMILFVSPVTSIVYNLVVRIKEINGGEEDEASKY